MPNITVGKSVTKIITRCFQAATIHRPRRVLEFAMSDRQSPTREGGPNQSPNTDYLLDSAFAQIKEDCRLYNEAVGSYNTHLNNHRKRRDLYELPFRSPISAHDAFEDVLIGNRSAIQVLLRDLIDQAHLDSEVRRHPRTYPIHIEAIDHLESARNQVITTLEETIRHIRDGSNNRPY